MKPKAILSQLVRVCALVVFFVGVSNLTAYAQQPVDSPENNARIEYNKGLELARANNFDEALQHFEKGIELDPTNARNFYMKAFVLGRQNQDAQAIEWYKRAAEVATAAEETQLAQQATSQAAARYVVLSARALQNNNAREALQHLNEAQELAEPDHSAHFYYAKAYNMLGNHEQAAQHAQQSLDMDTRGRTQKAGTYFELGIAQKYLGNRDAARAAFTEAAVGQFRQAAEYEIEHL